MKRAPIRTFIFSIFFYLSTAIACVALLPTLLFPRKYFMATVHIFVRSVYFWERLILGLDYEVRGAENLPQSGSYIVAAKHQSAYETMKLHLLFKDPAIVLKKELLRIPLWGMYLKKSDVIAIDRSSREEATRSIQEGAKRMMAQGRPIIIFPQGTRVKPGTPTSKKPYRVGVARIQEGTGLPIIPMALNAGMFWPKGSLLKSPGRAIFSFLKPIPAGKERSALMSKLEKEIENETTSLENEAREASAERRLSLLGTILGLLLLFGALAALYTYLWQETAKYIKQQYPLALADLTDAEYKVAEPIITGYPGKVKAYVPYERLQSEEGTVEVEGLTAEGWPIPTLPIQIHTGPIKVKNFRWVAPLEFDSFDALIDLKNNVLNISESNLQKDAFRASLDGEADLKQEPVPKLNLNLELENHDLLLQNLVASGAIETRIALFVGAGFNALANEEGIVEVPIAQKNNVIYAGPIPVLSLPVHSIEYQSGAASPGSRNVLVPSEQSSPE